MQLAGVFDQDLSGRRIVLDCANGATYKVAPAAFERLGAEVIAIATEPDGRNINEGCGSTHLGNVADVVRSEAAEIGFAFDGDGDRVLAVDADGREFDGDEIVAVAALHLKEAGTARRRRGHGDVQLRLPPGDGEAGVEVATTKVGDRFVIEELLNRDWTIGGEHVRPHHLDRLAATGDGLAAALLVMRALGDRHLVGVRPINKLPQYLRNVPISSREALEGADEPWQAVEQEGGRLEGRGRVLVRPSSSPLIRVMVEGPDEGECEDVLGRLVAAAERAVG